MITLHNYINYISSSLMIKWSYRNERERVRESCVTEEGGNVLPGPSDVPFVRMYKRM